MSQRDGHSTASRAARTAQGSPRCLNLQNLFTTTQGIFSSVFNGNQTQSNAGVSSDRLAARWHNATQSPSFKKQVLDMTLAPVLSLIIFFTLVTGWMCSLHWLRHHDDKKTNSNARAITGSAPVSVQDTQYSQYQCFPGPAQSAPRQFGVSRFEAQPGGYR